MASDAKRGSTMRAVSLKHGELALREVPRPDPGPGQVLVRTLACAICASDHHYMDHPEVSRDDRSGMRVDAPDDDVIMGHEYCAELVEYGPDTVGEWPLGTRVTSIPALLVAGGGMRIVGMAPDAPGGFGEYFLLTEFLTRAVPDDVAVEKVALNDAMAVGWGYTKVGVTTAPDAIPLVLGLGAIGLSNVIALTQRGSGPVIAADFSPERRALALELGADHAIDPGIESPWAAWRRIAWGSPEEVHDRMALAGRPPQLVYEMVGREGMLGDIIEHCEIGARVISCGGAAHDTIPTTVAQLKGVNLQIGGSPEMEDWYECLDLIVDGSIDPTPLIGETVPLEGLADAIQRARSADAPPRIVYTAE